MSSAGTRRGTGRSRSGQRHPRRVHHQHHASRPSAGSPSREPTADALPPRLPAADPPAFGRSHRVEVAAGSDYAERRKFSIIHEDPAALDKLRAEVGAVLFSQRVEDDNSTQIHSASYGRGALEPASGIRQYNHYLASSSKFLEQYPVVAKRRRVHLQSADLFECYSPVQRDRLVVELKQPEAFIAKRVKLLDTEIPSLQLFDQEQIREFLPRISGQNVVKIVQDDTSAMDDGLSDSSHVLGTGEAVTVGIVLSGGPAPGGHNVIAGVYDYLKTVNSESRVIGFKGGLDGLFKADCKDINDEFMDGFRNTGGFDMIWSGRGKVTDEEKPTVRRVLQDLGLNGLIIVGGDGSNSNAALLAEYVAEELPGVSVVGVPKTIDGDLKNEAIECSFGFDTAAKTYSESIGNLCMDCSIGQGVWHFVRVMGRSASHLVMECAMQTRPNLVIIGEEVEKQNTSLKELVTEIVELIEARWVKGQHYGIVLVPEGLVEFIPEFKVLMAELNALLNGYKGGTLDESRLSPASRELWSFLPVDDRQNLMAEREASGYVQVAKIATERLLLYCAEDMLKAREVVPVKLLNRMHHYFGYEGRCAMPSNFDAEYCYALGRTAGALVHFRKNGHMAVVKNLKAPTAQWAPMGVPFTMLMGMVKLSVGLRPGIKRQLVDLDSPAFKTLNKVRPLWKFGDYYRCPGPIQFAGPVSHLRNYVVQPPTEDSLLAGSSAADQAVQLLGRAVRAQRYGCYSDLQKERIQSVPQIPSLCTSPQLICQKGGQHLPQDPYIRRQVCLSLPNMCNDNGFYLREFCPFAQASGSIDSMIDEDASGRPRSAGSTPRTQHHSSMPHHHQGDSRRFSGTERAVFKPGQLRPTRVGVVFLSRQAPGIQNILWGCHERCKLNKGVCIGFKGVEGLLKKEYIEVTDDDLRPFKNLGGSDLIGRGIEHLLMEEAQWAVVAGVVVDLALDGLVLVGSSLAVTEASYLAEYFMSRRVSCCVIGVPATASNNLGGDLIEANIGFDTASKLYSSLIGNVLTDAASMPKYWHFVRLMGRQPSNEVLECALQTHPNIVIIAEEYGAAQKTLQHVVEDIADVVCRRAESEDSRRNFGAVIIPDGLWHHLPTFRMTMTDVDKVMSDATALGHEREAMDWLLSMEDDTAVAFDDATRPWQSNVPPWSLAVWKSLPPYIRQELLSSDKELRFTYVETERLLAQMVARELERRKAKGEYKGVFQCVCHYFGYQGRSAMPSVFDATLGFVHGHLATMCVEAKITAHLTTIRGLCGKIESWKLGAVPFNCLLTLVPSQQTSNLHPKLANREKAELPVIANAEINLNGKAFRWLKIARNTWEMQDRFCNPGPIQFWGQAAAYYHRILHEEQAEYSRMLQHTQKYAEMLKDACDFGVDEEYLKFVFTSLHGLLFLRHHPDNLVEDIGQIRPRHYPGGYVDHLANDRGDGVNLEDDLVVDAEEAAEDDDDEGLGSRFDGESMAGSERRR